MLEVILYIILTVMALMLAGMAYKLHRAYRLFEAPPRKSHLGPEVDLPSVSVCIPARNEQHALTECLERVVASTYEKLEIIVLDDVSGDDTSVLIKSFAHEGVRFVKGAALPSGWLGKNHALQGLVQEASGSYIFFMDVDTRLAPNALENLVRYALSQRASMVSVLPRREDGWRFSVVASPLRYFWELIFHRPTSPASASNAWLIRRKVLDQQFDGFTSFKNAIQPEAKIAAALTPSNEYRFLIGSENLGIGFEKKWPSQLTTSVRLLFPLLRKDIAFAAIATLDMLLLTAPFLALGSLAFLPFEPVHAYALMLTLGSYVIYSSYTRRVWRKGWIMGTVLWPLLLLQEGCLIIASTLQYKRRAVTWKGRTIRPEVRS
jgi:glycosyltransferase involved in cell wall biosynthesis